MAGEQPDNQLVRTIVKGMLRSGLVEEVVAFVQGLDEYDVVPAFISNEQDTEKIITTSHNPASLARVILDLADKDRKIGVVTRSCDARAIIELAKRNQVHLDNVYTIGLKCHGVTRINDSEINANCLRCQYPTATMADISCHDDSDKIFITVNTEKGQEIAEATNVPTGEMVTEPQEAEDRAIRQQQQDFGALQEMSLEERLDYWFQQFDKCIKCYGCRNSCPLCYCEDCYLNAGRGLVEAGGYPPEKIFHLTRLIHVADSCLNCGQCQAACPMNIPIATLYHMLNRELSAIFNYNSGFDITMMPPLGTITDDDKSMGGVEFG